MPILDKMYYIEYNGCRFLGIALERTLEAYMHSIGSLPVNPATIDAQMASADPAGVIMLILLAVAIFGTPLLASAMAKRNSSGNSFKSYGDY